MSKEKINYPQELVKSLKGENDLLTKENERLKNEVEELKANFTLKVFQQEQQKPMDFSNQVWKKYHFKNGKDYELALADSSGVLVFRDSIFSAPFDDKEDLNIATNDWKKCSLKRLLEKWWEENAPDALKDNYKITIPAAYNIFPDKLLPQDLRGKEQHWEIYKYWRNRLFGDHERLETDCVWTKSAIKTSYVSNDVYIVCMDGSLQHFYVTSGKGVVPACIPILNDKPKFTSLSKKM